MKAEGFLCRKIPEKGIEIGADELNVKLNFYGIRLPCLVYYKSQHELYDTVVVWNLKLMLLLGNTINLMRRLFVLLKILDLSGKCTEYGEMD